MLLLDLACALRQCCLSQTGEVPAAAAAAAPAAVVAPVANAPVEAALAPPAPAAGLAGTSAAAAGNRQGQVRALFAAADSASGKRCATLQWCSALLLLLFHVAAYKESLCTV
jgi:hypothetical protein